MLPRHFERILITRTSPFKLKRSTAPDPNQLSHKLEQPNLSKHSRQQSETLLQVPSIQCNLQSPLETTFGSIDRLDGPIPACGCQATSSSIASQPEAEQSANIRHLMSAPRRPRVVATPIQPYQPQVASRPSSKGEATKKSSESKERPTHEKRGGRQTPVIAEDNEHQTVSHHVKKSSVQRHKPDTSVSWATRSISTISSSSEPAAIKSPRRMTEPRKPAQAVPPKHQKSLSTSEAKGNSRHEPAQLKPISDPYLSEDKENPEPFQLKRLPSSHQARRQRERLERCFSSEICPSTITNYRGQKVNSKDRRCDKQRSARCARVSQTPEASRNNPHELILGQEQYTELYEALLKGCTMRK